MVQMSQGFRRPRDLFRVDPPVDPVTNDGLVLAVLVVVPEAVALLSLLLEGCGPPHHQLRCRWRTGLTKALVVVAGAVALVGFAYRDH